MFGNFTFFYILMFFFGGGGFFWKLGIFLKFAFGFLDKKNLFKVTKVTTKSYRGYYWTPKMLKIGPNSIISSFLAHRAKKPCSKAKALGRR